tara:strand:- start:2801 stop:3058 length:258 start_codon:yes stop_codon:yes gene_type:complete
MSDTHIHIHLGGEGETKVKKSKGKRASRRAATPSSPPTRNKGRKDPKMAKAMRQAHKAAKKKDGTFRKGWNRSKMMSHAHKLKKK